MKNRPPRKKKGLRPEGYESFVPELVLRTGDTIDNLKSERNAKHALPNDVVDNYDENQYSLLLEHFGQIQGPIVEIGSLQVGSTTSFRHKFPANEYVGLDMQDGRNVDVVANLNEGIGTCEEGHFELGICCSVMEHTPYPWKMAENISRLIKPGGALFLSVPWVWRYHQYPDDYYRYSPSAIKALYPDFEWKNCYLHTNVGGEIFERDELGYENKLSVMLTTPVEGKHRKYIPYVMVTMIGIRKPWTPKPKPGKNILSRLFNRH